MKAHIRRYVNEKHDVATAAKMKEALESHGGVRGSRVAVAAVNLANETGGTNKIKGISKLNSFEFTEEGIRSWSAYQIGPGKLVSCEITGEDWIEVVTTFWGNSPGPRHFQHEDHL